MPPRATKTEYAGRVYDSALEADYARQLDDEVAAGTVVSWRPQVAFLLQDAYSLDGERVDAIFYTADFLVQRPGRWDIVECKGRWGRDDRLRWKMLGYLSTRETPVNLLCRAGGIDAAAPIPAVRLVLHRKTERPKLSGPDRPKLSGPDRPVSLSAEIPARMGVEEARRRRILDHARGGRRR